MLHHSIGQRLKNLRKERQLTLKELAEQTGVSISFLSQVERGKSSVTLESLKKLADALNVSPSMFFDEEHTAGETTSIREQFFYKDLSDRNPDAGFSPILVTLHPGENKGNPFSHNGHEFLYVTEGILTVEIEGQQHQLHAQESIMFDARKPHYWFNHTDKIVRFLAVTSTFNTLADR